MKRRVRTPALRGKGPFLVVANLGPWGDYSFVLLHGFAGHSRGILKIDRVGPFVPGLSRPEGEAVVATDAFKAQLESHKFSGLQFARARLDRVVNLDWQKWDQSKRMPAVMPKGGEPENYIYQRRAAPSLKRKMEPLWELKMPIVPNEGPFPFDFQRFSSSAVFVSKRAATFLQAHAPWVVVSQGDKFLSGLAAIQKRLDARRRADLIR